MFSPANETQFILEIPGVSHDFQVLEFAGREALNTAFRFDIELISERPDFDLESLLNQPAFLTLDQTGTGFNGLIHSAEQGESGKRMTRYRVTLVPRVHYLCHRHNQRIFQHLNVPDIIATVLKEHGILSNAFRFQLGSAYPEREYCVQYDETDLHFINRLCEEEGIHYRFEHTQTEHIMVFGDDQTCFPKLNPALFQQDTGLVADHQVIRKFAVQVETRASKVSRRDYNFEKPKLTMEASHTGEAVPELEDYDYPGAFMDRARGKQLSQRTLERHRSDYQIARGKSDLPTLVSGHFMPLTEHPRSEWNDLWLLTELTHEGKQPQVLEESISSHVDDKDGFQQGYRNFFTAVPWDTIFRPALKHPKSKILGSQTAIVTGPAGEEIYCDQYGRVRVEFHWDRLDQMNEHSSCWLRVASNWAHEGYGAVTIPRIGMEVLVTFLEGDPDQPLITGCLHHAANLVPYNLPANKTRTVFKTRSTPGGNGFNELRIEDKAGAEQIYVHGQRDMDIEVGNCETHSVGVDRIKTIGQDETVVIGQNRMRIVKVDDQLLVGGSKVDSVSSTYLIEAGEGIRLVCGESVFEMYANGLVNISCVEFNISASGAGQINTGGTLDINVPGGKAGASPEGQGVKASIDAQINAVFHPSSGTNGSGSASQ